MATCTTTTTTTTSTTTELFSLPTDIHLSIVDALPYPSLINLRRTNRYFRYLFSDSQLSRARKRYIQSLFREEWEDRFRDDSRLMCYECFQWKQCVNFSRKQTTKKRAKGHAHAYKRFCIDCGVFRGRWHAGQFLKASGDEDRVLCRVCRLLRVTDDSARQWGLCSFCANGISVAGKEGV